MNTTTMNKALLKLDHCSACRLGGACDCPSVGETLAELASSVASARVNPLPPWIGEERRDELVAGCIGAVVRFVETNGLPSIGVIAARALCSGDVGFARDLGSARLAWTITEARALYGAMRFARERFGATVEPRDFGLVGAPRNVAGAARDELARRRAAKGFDR